MPGRRFLDLSAIARASFQIVQKHGQLRQDQLNLWTKTSSIARLVKNQTERVTLTVAAASALASRVDDSSSNEWRDTSQVEARRHGIAPVDLATINSNRVPSSQDKNNHPSSQSSHAPLQNEEVGTEVSNSTQSQSTTTKQERPPAVPQKVAVPQQAEIPEGINTDVFHSPRIARMLGGQRKPGELGLAHAVPAPVDASPQHEGINSDVFHVRVSGESATQPQITSADAVLSSSTKGTSGGTEVPLSELGEDRGLEDTKSSESSNGFKMRESKVPSSRIGRLWQYGGLASSMAFGAVGESFRRLSGRENTGSLMLSPENIERLVAKLSRMRGAALKLGQIMSFQDSKFLPAQINEVLQRVQDNADYMPASQRDRVLSANLGSDWRSLFSSFEEIPMAAASIGQVHKATLASSGQSVAVKIQYPGVAQSISSDLNNLSLLLTASRLLPRGLYLEKTIANARTELAWECDYVREASFQKRFRDLLADQQDVYVVPKVFDEACGPQVLTAEFMHGTAVTKKALSLNQEQRDWIGTNILKLCFRELTEFKLMQTDPNWTNFLYNPKTRRLELLDFGAAREYPEEFVDPYIRILIAAAEEDSETVRALSLQLGYLTGHESQSMVRAHVDSVLILAEPFRSSQNRNHPYDFRDQTVTDRVRAQIPVMLRERLAPPPEETYSLHRKLSGAFLLLARLGSRVKCRELFEDATSRRNS